MVGPQPDTTLSLTCPYPAACSFRLPACNWRICCNLSMSSSFSCTNTQQTDHAAHLLSACNCCVLYRQNMQLSFCMCIAGSMGFGSAGSKQRTHHVHSASSLCIAFPLWPPSVPLRPGSFPGRCCAAVHAQSSSHHTLIPLRLGAQLQTVSSAAHTFMLHAARIVPGSIHRSSCAACPFAAKDAKLAAANQVHAMLMWQCNAQSWPTKLYLSILLLLLLLAQSKAVSGIQLKAPVCHVLHVQCVAFTNIRLLTCTCRPYLYTAIISAAVTVPFLLVKASIFDRPSYHPPAVFLFLDFLGFSLLHILVARKVVGWARNRYKLGLLGQSHPWQVSTVRCVRSDSQVFESGRAFVVWSLVGRQCVNLLQFWTLWQNCCSDSSSLIDMHTSPFHIACPVSIHSVSGATSSLVACPQNCAFCNACPVQCASKKRLQPDFLKAALTGSSVRADLGCGQEQRRSMHGPCREVR